MCELTQLIHAYHDGELSPDVRRTVEAHLPGCPQCSEMLTEIDAVSARLQVASIPPYHADFLNRLHEIPRQSQQRMVLRVAEWLTTAAAIVLIFGVTGLLVTPSSTPLPATAWEQAAIAPPVDDGVDVSDPTQMLAWNDSEDSLP